MEVYDQVPFKSSKCLSSLDHIHSCRLKLYSSQREMRPSLFSNVVIEQADSRRILLKLTKPFGRVFEDMAQAGLSLSYNMIAGVWGVKKSKRKYVCVCHVRD